MRNALARNGTRPFILLVEDNPDDIAFVRRALGKVEQDIGLVIAPDGEKGLEACHLTDELSGKREFVRPLFILLDLKLPKVDGLEVYRCFRESAAGKDIPIILNSSSKEEVERLEQEGLGADDYLFKPITPENLLSYLQKYGASGPTA